MIYLGMDECKIEAYEAILKSALVYPNRGIELFPDWGDEAFIRFIEKNKTLIKRVGCAYHGPAKGVEHSAGDEDPLCKTSFHAMKRTIESAALLHSRYISYQFNSSSEVLKAEEFERRKNISLNHLKMFSRMADGYGISLAVENTGTRVLGNMMFDEEAFVRACKYTDYYVLIDVENALENGWNLSRVIKELRNKIIGYRLPMRHEMRTMHKIINLAAACYSSFWESYKRYTPYAELVLTYDFVMPHRMEEVVSDMLYVEQESGHLQRDTVEEV